jgi:hypothetical protein
MLTGALDENFFKAAFFPPRHARGETPVRRLNQELKLPKLSNPTEKQISVTANSVRSHVRQWTALMGATKSHQGRRNQFVM